MADSDEALLHVEYIPLGELKKWERNLKGHDFSSVLGSFRRFGFVAPSIIDEASGMLVVGNGRLEVLERVQAEGSEAELPPATIVRSM